MQANSSFSGLHQFAWDATSISLAMTCPRKYEYTMLQQIQPRERSVHLIFGGFYAEALEHFYKYRAEGLSLEDALVRVVRETMIATWGEDGPIQFAHNAKTRHSLIRTIVWYVDQFGEENENTIQTYHLSNGKPAVELSFSLDITEDVLFCGHLDRVVTYAGDLFVADQKTTGSTVSPSYFEQYKPDVQMSMYTFAGRAILHTPVRGVLIDAAQIAVGFTRFERAFTYRTDEELDEWAFDTLSTIKQIHSYADVGRFPRNLTACGNYGGCSFRRLCSAAPQLRDKVIELDFTQKIWDPLERR